jgi:tetratricopeptide (TPR) repeat protein
MLDEADHEAVYTAEELTKKGVNADQTPRMFSIFAHKIQKSAYAKDMNNTSDLVDEDGDPLKPYGWKRSNWIKHIPTNVYNRAAKIINQACDMHEENGRDGDTYWYGQSCGLIRVSAARYATHIERLNKAYEIIGHRASGEGDAFRKVGLPLSLNATYFEQELSKKKSKGKKSWFAAVAVAFTLFGVFASYKGNFWGVLQDSGVQAAREHLDNQAPQDRRLDHEAWIAYREGDYEKAEQAINILLSNPEYDNYHGNSYYILGLINLAKAQYSDAVNYLEKAKIFAEWKEVEQLLAPVNYALSMSYFYTEDWASFDLHINSLPESFLANALHLKAWKTALADADFLYAIEQVESAIKVYINDGKVGDLNIAKLDLAIFYSFAGKPGYATELISEVELFMQANPGFNDSLFYRTQLCNLAIAKCSDWGELPKIEAAITEHAKLNQKGIYLSVMTLIEKLECQEEI